MWPSQYYESLFYLKIGFLELSPILINFVKQNDVSCCKLNWFFENILCMEEYGGIAAYELTQCTWIVEFYKTTLKTLGNGLIC